MKANSCLASLALLLAHSFCLPLSAQPTAQPPTPPARANALDVASAYKPSGRMGDAIGTKNVQFNESWKDGVHSKPTCIKVSYNPGAQRWAGIYWQNKPDNWGDQPGDDLSTRNFRRITFWAKGQNGEESVEFKAGGISASEKKYKDSFEVTTGKLQLERDWKKYEIKLEGQNLSCVIGVFCWVIDGAAHPNGATFFLDDIQYE